MACYVNPNNPKESVIDRSLNNSFIATITPIIYPLLIVFAIYAVYRYRKTPLLAGENQSFPSLSERTNQLMKAVKKVQASEQKDPLLIWSNQLSNIFYIAMMIIVYIYCIYLSFIEFQHKFLLVPSPACGGGLGRGEYLIKSLALPL